MSGDKLPIVDQCTGRARFCEDRGEVKTPGLLREAASTITELVSALRTLTARRHTHVAGDPVKDKCAQCGADFRNPVHYRDGESAETDWIKARALLAQQDQSQ